MLLPSRTSPPPPPPCVRSIGNMHPLPKNDRDEELNIYSLASLAIVMSYFSVGVALELLYTPVAYYLIDDLGAESGVYTVWVILVTLPWSFKVQ